MQTRRYQKMARAEGEQRTRQAVLDAAQHCFLAGAYERVTIAEVAARAGVTVQTIHRIHGSKDALFVAVVTSVAGGLIERRDAVAAGHTREGLAQVTDDYRTWGDIHEQLQLRARHFPELDAVIEDWRSQHRRWVCRMFAHELETREQAARRQTVALLVVALGIETYRRLRMERLSHRATVAAMARLAEAILAQ